jgi:2-oxoglutarate dehydrogenase E1 component
MAEGTSFQPILNYSQDVALSNSSVVFLTSGKFVYDIQQLITENKGSKTALLAIEELYPFPEAKLEALLKDLSKNAQVYWVQEENFNGGAFQFVQPRISRILCNLSITAPLKYVGRRAVAAVAVGSSELHKK